MSVYIIYSKDTLSEIRSFLEKFGSSDKIGTLRVNYDRDGFETNLTIAVLDSTIYDSLVAAGYDQRGPGVNFWIGRYELSERNYPREGFTSNFYLPLPRDLQLTKAEIEQQVREKLNPFVASGQLDHSSYKIVIPHVSRETGELRGSCFVTFGESVPLKTRALIRVALDSTTWYSQSGHHEDSRCFWAFDGSKKKKKTVTAKAVPKNTAQPKRRLV